MVASAGTTAQWGERHGRGTASGDGGGTQQTFLRPTVRDRSLLLGIPRRQVCQIHCRTDRMVWLWIELFNRGGIDALITRPKPGRPRKVKLQRVRDLLVPVLEDPAQAGQVHWMGVKIPAI